MSTPLSSAAVAQSGRSGVVIVSGTAPVVGQFSAVQVVQDAMFSAWTEDGAVGVAGMTGKSFPAGLVLYGRINGFTLSTGMVRAYVAGGGV